MLMLMVHIDADADHTLACLRLCDLVSKLPFRLGRPRCSGWAGSSASLLLHSFASLHDASYVTIAWSLQRHNGLDPADVWCLRTHLRRTVWSEYITVEVFLCVAVVSEIPSYDTARCRPRPFGRRSGGREAHSREKPDRSLGGGGDMHGLLAQDW
jgi:hypothetical protein